MQVNQGGAVSNPAFLNRRSGGRRSLQFSWRSCSHDVQIDQMDDLQFFNPFGDIRLTANRLPHWQQKGAVYSLHFGWPTQSRGVCSANGKMIVRLG
jgi:hypothetical protein